MASTQTQQPRTDGGAGAGAGARGGRGFGRGGAAGGDRAAGRGGPKGGPRRPGAGPRKGGAEWRPLTKLGRLVQANKVESFEEIFRMAVPIKEPEIIKYISDKQDSEVKWAEEVMKVKPVQKQTKAGQRTRFKAWVLIGDRKGHLGLGQASHKEVQIAIKTAIGVAKVNLIPIRFGYWGNKIGAPHTVPFKVTGKNGSVSIRLIPAPKGTGIVGAPTSKKVLQIAGVSDCYTASWGCTKTMGNFLFATFKALSKTFTFLTPDFWGSFKLERGFMEKLDDAKKQN